MVPRGQRGGGEVIKQRYLYKEQPTIPGQMDMKRQAVVQVGEGNPVLSPHRLPDDDFIDVVEFIPVLITRQQQKLVLMEREGRKGGGGGEEGWGEEEWGKG